jgi:4-amino-4-deoxy-L-arabinose transferase-like glycosyltransferase
MWLVLFMTTAHWAGYELLRSGRERPTSNAEHPTPNSEHVAQIWWRWWFMFYVALAFGFLAKGPIAWAPLLTLVAMKLLVRDVDLAKRFKFGRGILITLTVVALWGVPALIQTQGEFFRIGIGRHVVGRSFGAMEGHGANSLGVYLLLLPLYFGTIFASFFPWSIKLPAVAKKLWRDRDEIDIYLLAGVGIIFVIFSLIKTKLPHYTLPAFPLLALLLARSFLRQSNSSPSKLDGFKPSSVKRVVVGMAFVYVVIALAISSFVAPSFPAHSLFERSRDSLKPEMEFGAVDFQEPSLVWYFRSQVKGWMTPLNSASAPQFMEKDGARFVILPTSLAATTFPEPPATWKSFSTRGFNIAKGKDVDLTLMLKPD